MAKKKDPKLSKKTLSSVKRGIKQAKEGKIFKGPDLKKADKLSKAFDKMDKQYKSDMRKLVTKQLKEEMERKSKDIWEAFDFYDKLRG